MDTRKFFFVCAGILCLAAAYHLGATSTGAQSVGGAFVGLSYNLDSKCFALTSTGDVWKISSNAINPGTLYPEYFGNILSGPVPIEGTSFGKIKAKNR